MVNATWIDTPNYTPGRGFRTIDHITRPYANVGDVRKYITS